MNLIAILVAIGTEGFWKSLPVLRHFQGVVRYACWLHARWGERGWFDGAAGVALAIAPAVVIVGLLQQLLASGGGLILWLVNLAFSVAVLVFCIGVRELNEHLDGYLDSLERGNPEGAYLHVREILAGRSPGNANEMNRMLIEAILIRNNERLLAILFWFVILGPVGAVLYRSATQLKGVVRSGHGFGDGFLEAVLRLQAILDWLPARVTALCYAVIGSFVDAVHQWRQRLGEGGLDLYSANMAVLTGSGLGALRMHEQATDREIDTGRLREEVLETQALVKRTVIAWLTVFALLTIVGWLT